jgi:hypothetical protein
MWVQHTKNQNKVWRCCFADSDAPTCACAPVFFSFSLAQELCLPLLGNFQSHEPQGVSKSITQIIEETLLLLLASVHIIGCIARKLCETSDILAHHHGSMFQILELLLELDNTLCHMVGTKSNPEFLSVDALRLLMRLHVGIPPVRRRAYQLVRS